MSFHAGTKANIIPSDAKFEATLERFHLQHAKNSREAKLLCEKLPRLMDLKLMKEWGQYPVTINHEHAQFVADTAAEVSVR